jgi:spermidine synthase
MHEMARGRSSGGELVLSGSDDGTLELRVNGVLVMSSAETSTEDLLARRVLELLTAPGGLPIQSGLSIVVGGLGLGVTLARLLRSEAVSRVLVAEIEPELVAWHRDGVVPHPDGSRSAGLLADPRVQVEVDDVRAVVARLSARSVDAIILDVDNGPGFLVYDANADVYGERFLLRCADSLSAGGIIAVWSAEASSALLGALGRAFERVDEEVVPVRLGRRLTTYHVFVGHHLPEPPLP